MADWLLSKVLHAQLLIDSHILLTTEIQFHFKKREEKQVSIDEQIIPN